MEINETEIVNAKEKVILHIADIAGAASGSYSDELKEMYPYSFKRYSQLCSNYSYKREELLGKIQEVEENGKINVHMFCKNRGVMDIDALKKCLKTADHKYEFLPVAVPWQIVEETGLLSLIENNLTHTAPVIYRENAAAVI